MNRIRPSFIFVMLLLALSSASSRAATASPVDNALEAWNGERTLLLRTDMEDPLSSPAVQKLLPELVGRGFAVTPASLDADTETGLVLDVRESVDGVVLALSRAEDGAIVAFEKRAPEEKASARTAQPGGGKSKSSDAASSRPSCLPPGLNEIDGRPRAIALLDATEGACEILVLHDYALVLQQTTRDGMKETARFPAPMSASRGLHLDAGDIDGDGEKEIAVVWGEDEKSIYKGNDTRLHAWILHTADGTFQRASNDLEGYLRIIGKKGYLQRRDRYAPFAHRVLSLIRSDEGFALGDPVEWPNGVWLYALTPTSNGQGLLLTEENRLALVDLDAEKPAPHARLPETLGNFQGPGVAVRLRETEYLLGFEKEDQINVSYHHLPRRSSTGPANAIATILRGRRKGMAPFVEPAGTDALVVISASQNRLTMQKPFEPLPLFVRDFALVPAANGLSALLLLNDKADGSSKNYLLYQSAE